MTERTLITIGAAEPAYDGRATYVDGARAEARPVRLSFDDASRALVIHSESGPPERWPYDDLRAQKDQARREDGLVLSLRDGRPARLYLDARDTRLIRTRARRLGRRVHKVPHLRLAGLSLAAILSVALVVAVIVPALADRLAGQLSPQGEAVLGEMTRDQVRSALGTGAGPAAVCDAGPGRAALDTILERLGPAGDGAPPLVVTGLDVAEANAFALPGGQILLFRGLIETAASPEEVAAVLAHEIGHVAARDPTRIALRSAGSIGILGLLFGDFAGGALVLLLAEQLMQSGYSQAAEAAADAFAHARLVEAGVSPAAIADLFQRIAAEGDEIPDALQRFMAHPGIEGRIDAARAAVPEGFEPRPLLDAAGWAALRAVCEAVDAAPSDA